MLLNTKNSYLNSSNKISFMSLASVKNKEEYQ